MKGARPQKVGGGEVHVAFTHFMWDLPQCISTDFFRFIHVHVAGPCINNKRHVNMRY